MQTILPKAEVHRTFSVSTLWRHSIRTAAAASMLAKISGAWESEQAFAAGLIHDLGILVEIESDRELLAQVVAKVSEFCPTDQHETMRALELKNFGADHQHFGFAMCQAWGFPDALNYVAAHHHEPLAFESPHQKLAAIVYLAEDFCADCEHGVSSEPTAIAANPEILACIGMTAEEFNNAGESMIQAADDIEAAF